MRTLAQTFVHTVISYGSVVGLCIALKAFFPDDSMVIGLCGFLAIVTLLYGDLMETLEESPEGSIEGEKRGDR